MAGPSSDYGYAIYVYRMYDSVNDKMRVGTVKLDGVEFINGGQEGLLSKAAVNFVDLIGS